ncbi:MAG: DUF1080 domain-containing protein [Planctomycetota bacterium]
MHHLILRIVIVVVIAVVLPNSIQAQQLKDSYQVQGEYSGRLSVGTGDSMKFGLQVIALGNQKFTGVGYHGGLPGDGWLKDPPVRIENVAMADGILTLKGDEGVARVQNGQATILDPAGNEVGSLKRIVRKSPTMGQQPPEKGIVLFDGKSLENWTKARKNKAPEMTDNGLLKQGANSKQRFQSHRLHIEFRLPYQPEKRGQARGNSGLYMQGRYEVQMLDSFGLSGEQNECGGIYSLKKPDLNMCLPPMQWQTYDVEFHAAKYDGEKKSRILG